MDQRFAIPENERPMYYSRTLPSIGRLFMVEIKSFHEGRPSGTVHHLFFPEPLKFSGFDAVVLLMDDMMDKLNNPQAFTELRSFGEHSFVTSEEKQQRCEKPIFQFWYPDSFSCTQNNAAVFYIRILYRKNSSWQGEIICPGHKKVCFRSVLELLHLLQSVFLS